MARYITSVENKCPWVADRPDVTVMMVECSDDGDSAHIHIMMMN